MFLEWNRATLSTINVVAGIEIGGWRPRLTIGWTSVNCGGRENSVRAMAAHKKGTTLGVIG